VLEAKAGCSAFQCRIAGCNEQVFSPKSCKKISEDLVVFEKKTQKTHTLILKNYVAQPKAWLNQLNC